MEQNEIKIERAVFQTHDETYYLNPKDNIEYLLDYVDYGEYGADWIVVKENGKEISRHSLKFCVFYDLKEAV